MCNPDVINYITEKISYEEYNKYISDYKTMKPAPLIPKIGDKLIYFGEGHKNAYLRYIL